jgi:hypothetical protein
MPLRVAYRRVVGLIAEGLFKNPFEVRYVGSITGLSFGSQGESSPKGSQPDGCLGGRETLNTEHQPVNSQH